MLSLSIIRRHIYILGLEIPVFLFGTCIPTGAYAPPPPEQTAVITGVILDSSSSPVSGVFVAAYDAKKNVVSSTHTNAKGQYSLGVPRSTLHVDRKGKTFFTQVKTNFNRAVTVATTVIPVAHMVSEGSNAIKGSKSHSQVQQTIVVDGSLATAGSAKLPTPADAQKMPGAVMIKAVAPGRVDVTAVTQAYWIQQETPQNSNEGVAQPTIVGFMDPVVMPRNEAGKRPSITAVPLDISDAQVMPSLVKHGDTVHFSARFAVPQSPKIFPILVARDAVSGLIWELKPAGNSIYTASIKVDEFLKPNDHTISVLAYAAEGPEGGRRPDLEVEIEKSKLWDLKRPFINNPLLLVCRNRADMTLTVVPDTNIVRIPITH
jgi:hypothetical protein